MSDATIVPTWFDLLTKIGVPTIQMGLVVLGWNIVSKGNDARETRKEIRSILAEVKKTAADVEEMATKYYQASVNEGRAMETRIKRALTQIGTLTTSVTRLNHKVEVSSSLADYKDVVTGGDFESAQRTAVQAHDKKLDAIASATTIFVDEIERIFAEAYTRKLAWWSCKKSSR